MSEAMKYKILEHPAELRLKIYGKTVEELFMNAAEAMADILKRDAKLRIHANLRKEKLEIQSFDLNSLLVDFLSEILARSQINKCVYFIDKINVTTSAVLRTSDVQKLKAELLGYAVEHFDEDIKAVTYQDLNIQKIKGVWQTILVFDV